MGNTEFMPDSAQDLNAWITMSALFVAATQLLFFINMIWSLAKGPKSDPESLGCDDPRVADAGSPAEARQLGARIAGRLSLGL